MWQVLHENRWRFCTRNLSAVVGTLDARPRNTASRAAAWRQPSWCSMRSRASRCDRVRPML